MSMYTNKERDYRNFATINTHLPAWFKNVRMNISYMNEQEKKKSIALGSFQVPPPLNESKACILVASGPSLEDDLFYIKKLQGKYPIFASLTNLSALLKEGIIPTAVLCCDSAEAHVKDVYNLISNRDIPLICPPIIHPGVIDFFKPNVYFYKNFIQNEAGNVKGFFNQVLDTLFDNLPDFLVQAGSVTNQLLLLIAYMIQGNLLPGDMRVLIAGGDHAFSKDLKLSRVPIYEEAPALINAFDVTLESDQREYIFKPVNYRSVINLKAKRVIRYQNHYTTISMYNYKRSLYLIWLNLNVPLFRTSRKGILTELPYFSLKHLAAGKIPTLYKTSIVQRAMKKLKAEADPDYINLTAEEVSEIKGETPIPDTTAFNKEVAGNKNKNDSN